MKATVGRIWEAASRDDSRPVLTHVMFDAVSGTLTATNSYILARVPCTVEEGDESGLIPAEALKTAAGRSLRVADGKATLTLPNGERSWTLLAKSAFPNCDTIIDGYEPAGIRFGLNARLLYELSGALGVGKDFPVGLHPTSPVKGMRVDGAAADAIGVIMPVRLPDTGSSFVPAPDLKNDAAVIAAVRVAAAAIDGRRGKKKAAQAFRDALASFEAAA